MAKTARFWGVLLLGIWLIAFGVLQLGLLTIPWFDAHKALAGVAIIAGVLLVVSR
jgi:hypothetical protein